MKNNKQVKEKWEEEWKDFFDYWKTELTGDCIVEFKAFVRKQVKMAREEGRKEGFDEGCKVATDAYTSGKNLGEVIANKLYPSVEVALCQFQAEVAKERR